MGIVLVIQVVNIMTVIGQPIWDGILHKLKFFLVKRA